jgi:outer membrane protein assembly factor BamA
MTSRWTVLAFLILCAGRAVGQEVDTLADPATPLGIVDTVIVTGNEKTLAYVILDEMTLTPGSVVTAAEIEFDRGRIYSLGLFNRVDISYDRMDSLRVLIVDVHERWYLIPVPLFGFRDGDPKKPYFGGGVLHNNFLGRNQKVFLSLVFGYNPSFDVFFSDPQIDREHHLFFSGSLSFSRVRNRSERETALSGEFDERHADINSTIGQRLSLYESAGINLGYHNVDVGEYRPGRTVSTTGRDAYFYGRLFYAYDSRDIREYPMAGRFVSVWITRYGFGTSGVDYTRLGADTRAYIRLPLTLTCAIRLHGTMVAGGTVPTYSRVYFGYGDRIRGYFKTVFEGEHMLGSSVELRYPLLPARIIEFRAGPLPREFTVWRFGLSAVLFGDAGTVWFRGERLRLASVASGYGGGIDILLPYSAVIRLAYARNDTGKDQFIFDFRAAF